MRRLIIALLAICALASCALAQTPAVPTVISKPAQPPTLKTILLAPPQLAKGIPVMQALSKRMSTRTITDAKLTDQQLSEILGQPTGSTGPPTSIGQRHRR